MRFSRRVFSVSSQWLATVACCLALYRAADAQNYLIPTPYPTPTEGPSPTPVSLFPNSRFPSFQVIILNPQPKPEDEYWQKTAEEREAERHLDSKTLAGKVLYLYFWTADSSAIREEMPYLIDLYAKYHSQGLEILGVSLDLDVRPVQQFIADWRITWPIVCEEHGWESSLAALLKVQSLPQNFLVDKDGVLRAMSLLGERMYRETAALVSPAPVVLPALPVQTVPAALDPGTPFALTYVPLQDSHKRAEQLEAAFPPVASEDPWTPVRLSKSRGSGGEIRWTGRLTFPRNQLQASLYIGVDLARRPPSSWDSAPDIDMTVFETKTLERIRWQRGSAREAEAQGNWTRAGGLWHGILHTRPVEPFSYVVALLGTIRAALEDPTTGNAVGLTDALRNACPPLDLDSTERAVWQSLGGSAPVDPWLANAAASLLIQVADSVPTTATLAGSYNDTLAWALYRAGYPDRALRVQSQIPIPLLFQDPGLGIRLVLYSLTAGDAEYASRLLRLLERDAGRLMESMRDLPPYEDMIARQMPLERLRALDTSTTPTLPSPRSPGQPPSTAPGPTSAANAAGSTSAP